MIRPVGIMVYAKTSRYNGICLDKSALRYMLRPVGITVYATCKTCRKCKWCPCLWFIGRVWMIVLNKFLFPDDLIYINKNYGVWLSINQKSIFRRIQILKLKIEDKHIRFIVDCISKNLYFVFWGCLDFLTALKITYF